MNEWSDITIMNAWWCLFRKEFRLMRAYAITNGLLLLFGGIFAISMANSYHHGLSSLVLFIAMIWHSVYLLLYMFKSLRAEKKNTPLWLQSPQSGWMLIFAKFAAGLVMMGGSLGVNLILWLWAVHLDFLTGLYQGPSGLRFLLSFHSQFMQHWGLLALESVQCALLLAALGCLIYFIVNICKYVLRGWRWMLFPILIFITLHLIVRFNDTSFYNTLFHWGKLNIPEFSTLFSIAPSSHAHFSQMPGSFFVGPLYWGDILYRFFLTAVFFYAAGWLLDRKVEV